MFRKEGRSPIDNISLELTKLGESLRNKNKISKLKELSRILILMLSRTLNGLTLKFFFKLIKNTRLGVAYKPTMFSLKLILFFVYHKIILIFFKRIV